MGGVGSIDVLRDEIIRQATEQSATILDRAQRVSERDLEFAKEEADEIRRQQREKIQPAVEMERKRIIAATEMEARRRLLEKKEELVSRIFSEVESKINEMRGSESYMATISRLIEDGVSIIGGKSIVHYSEKDEGIFTEEFISSVKLRIKNVEVQFRCIKDEISSGVIIRSIDGKVIVDNSFSSLIRRLKEELRGKVSEILLQD